jgi:hypothetical protein
MASPVVARSTLDRMRWPAALAAFGLAVAAVFWPLFDRMARGASIDFSAHLRFARNMARDGAPHSERFGFELLTLLVAGFADEAVALVRAAAVVATLATALKAVMSAQWLSRRLGARQALVLAAVVLFVAPITFATVHPTWRRHAAVHLGQMSGLIFHNPTTVLVFPFVIALFVATWRGKAVAAGALAAAQCLVKPNFVLAWAPAFVVLELRRRGFDWRSLARVAAVLAPATAVLTWQYLTTEKLGEAMVIAPFRAWRQLSPNIPLSIARSVAFPALLVALHFREVRRRGELLFAWAILAVATLQYALLYLKGAAYPGNWSWGRYLAIYLVFLLSVELFAGIAARRESWRGVRPAAANATLALVLALHVGSGLLYYWQGVRSGLW